jgi:hypothetical protein
MRLLADDLEGLACMSFKAWMTVQADADIVVTCCIEPQMVAAPYISYQMSRRGSFT